MGEVDLDWAQRDAEANTFAIELLMPEEWVRRDAAGVDLLDDRQVERLAKRYKVPNSLMAFRLGQLFASTSQ